MVTVVESDPSSIASSFAYASQIDSFKHVESSQDRPTGEPPETTPIFYTHTAYGPAVIGSDDPNDASIFYKSIATTLVDVAETTVSYAAEVTPAQRLNATNAVPTPSAPVLTITTYLSTVTVYPSQEMPSSNLSMTRRGVQKRQTCSMVFASMFGQWASWCNEWDGHTTIKHSTYLTTVLMTNPPGGSPIPESVYKPSTSSEEISTSSIQETSSSTAQGSAASTSSSTSVTEGSAITTSIVVTASVVVTYPVTTITQTSAEPSSSSTTEQPPASCTCGQVGRFVITFDDLPRFSTSKPENETTAPPIFDPYNHFYWSNAFGYGPPPTEPFAPHDGDRLAEYNPAYEIPAPTENVQGRDLPGSFGAGPRSFNNIFWFDAKSVYIGCNNTASSAPCEIIATGYRWIASNAPNASKYEGHEKTAFSQRFTTPGPCAERPCPLTQIFFDAASFSGLSTLNFQANLGGAKTGFYLDSFEGAWTNSTCEAGIERSTSRR